MKWIVTGGTGLVGRKLVKAIDRDGNEIVVLSRHAAPHSGHVRTVAWDPEKIGSWTKEVDGADVVVHLSGEPLAEGRWTDERLAKIRSSRIVSTKLIADAIASADNKPIVFVSASAVGYYGSENGDAKLDEESAPGADVLAQICVDWEKAADPAQAFTRVVHPRIGIVLSPDGGVLKAMLPAFRAFVGGPVGTGKQWESFIHIDDLVRAILFVVENEKIAGPFNATAPNPVTMNDFAASLARVLHRPNLFRVPAAAMRVALGKMADMALTGQRVSPRKLLDFGFEFHFPEIAGALQELLVHP